MSAFNTLLNSRLDSHVNALTILIISEQKEETLLMFGPFISWRHNHLYFRLPIFFFISAVPRNWSITKAAAMCTYIKNRQRWEELLWSHFLALHLETGKSWRVRRKKEPLSDKHHLLSKSFETPPKRPPTASNVCAAPLTRASTAM